jgi:signal transduction histidine kinase
LYLWDSIPVFLHPNFNSGDLPLKIGMLPGTVSPPIKMIDKGDSLFNDFHAVRQIPIVPTMLEVICQITGMGFAAIARVTNDRWLACSVRDEVQFGLEAGGELKIETTLCNEIRDSREPVIIDHVDLDPYYKNHHTPNTYGLQSYISVPIILKNGIFFGTLCAIDAKPAKVNNPTVIGTFNLFAELLAFHLQSLELLEHSYQVNNELSNKNRVLTTINNDLDNIVYTASHDLKSPITNLESLVDTLSDTVSRENIDREEINQIMGMMKSSLKRFAVTIKDLTTIVETNHISDDEQPEAINILELVENIKQDLNHLIVASEAKIEVICENKLLINASRKHLKSILYNLLSNALKYRSPERKPEIRVKMHQADGKMNLLVVDNGLGIPADKQDKAFTMFKRFHDHVEGSGLGLYIVKRMVDNMKGQIKMSSSLHKGTTFTITF